VDAKTKICQEIMSTKDVLKTQAQMMVLEAFTNIEKNDIAKALAKNVDALVDIQISNLIDRVQSVEFQEKKPTRRKKRN
jgi:mannose/cellobiose epimerase-like protein (N-acyl-D-glucosamine 2-epimerase family)